MAELERPWCYCHQSYTWIMLANLRWQTGGGLVEGGGGGGHLQTLKKIILLYLQIGVLTELAKNLPQTHGLIIGGTNRFATDHSALFCRSYFIVWASTAFFPCIISGRWKLINWWRASIFSLPPLGACSIICRSGSHPHSQGTLPHWLLVSFFFGVFTLVVLILLHSTKKIEYEGLHVPKFANAYRWFPLHSSHIIWSRCLRLPFPTMCAAVFLFRQFCLHSIVLDGLHFFRQWTKLIVFWTLGLRRIWTGYPLPIMSSFWLNIPFATWFPFFFLSRKPFHASSLLSWSICNPTLHICLLSFLF
jgi:hypothetical protein